MCHSKRQRQLEMLQKEIQELTSLNLLNELRKNKKDVRLCRASYCGFFAKSLINSIHMSTNSIIYHIKIAFYSQFLHQNSIVSLLVNVDIARGLPASTSQ